MSSQPSDAAYVRGVTPALVCAFTLAPASSSDSTSSCRPHLAAQCSEVMVLASVVSTLAPSSSALSNASWSPISAALIRSSSGVALFFFAGELVAAAGACETWQALAASAMGEKQKGVAEEEDVVSPRVVAKLNDSRAGVRPENPPGAECEKEKPPGAECEKEKLLGGGDAATAGGQALPAAPPKLGAIEPQPKGVPLGANEKSAGAGAPAPVEAKACTTAGMEPAVGGPPTRPADGAMAAAADRPVQAAGATPASSSCNVES